MVVREESHELLRRPGQPNQILQCNKSGRHGGGDLVVAGIKQRALQSQPGINEVEKVRAVNFREKFFQITRRCSLRIDYARPDVEN